MDIPAAAPAAIMVLAYWPESGDRMVVRITTTLSVAQSRRTVTYAGTEAEVIANVQKWLELLTTERQGR